MSVEFGEAVELLEDGIVALEVVRGMAGVLKICESREDFLSVLEGMRSEIDEVVCRIDAVCNLEE